MSKLSSLMRNSISAEKQSLEHGHVEVLKKKPQRLATVVPDLGFIQNYYESYIAIIRSQTKLYELIQKEQISIIENNIASSFKILNSLKNGFKSLQS
jgi:hypothetical protein